jgi:general secretion pathway protein G
MHRKIAGFSTTEVLMVMGILVVGLAVGLPTYLDHRKRTLVAVAKKDIAMISQRLERFQSLNYRYPEYLSDMGVDMQDPWGNDYQYLNMGDVDPDTGDVAEGGGGPKPTPRKKGGAPLNTDYELFSMGEDGAYAASVSAAASLDDVVRADNGAAIEYAADL